MQLCCHSVLFVPKKQLIYSKHAHFVDDLSFWAWLLCLRHASVTWSIILFKYLCGLCYMVPRLWLSCHVTLHNKCSPFFSDKQLIFVLVSSLFCLEIVAEYFYYYLLTTISPPQNCDLFVRFDTLTTPFLQTLSNLQLILKRFFVSFDFWVFNWTNACGGFLVFDLSRLQLSMHFYLDCGKVSTTILTTSSLLLHWSPETNHYARE